MENFGRKLTELRGTTRGARFFGGGADDPFFLDDTGATRLVASSIAHPGNPDKSLLGFRQGARHLRRL